MFRRLSIRAKLACSFLILTLVFAASGTVAIWQLRKIESNLDALSVTMERSNRILYLNALMQEYRADVAQYLLEGRVDQYTGLEAATAQVEEAAALAAELVLNPTEFQNQVTEPWAVVSQAMNTAAQWRVTGNTEGAQTLFAGASAGLDEIIAATNDRVVSFGALRDAAAAELHQTLTNTRLMVLVVLGINIVVAIGFIFIIPPAISRPVVALAAASERLATGDLTVEELDVRSEDEIGRMSESFNTMVRSMRTVISDVVSTSDTLLASSEEMALTGREVASAAQQIASVIQQVAAGTSNQNVSVEETARAMEQLRAAIDQISKGAQTQANEVQRTSRIVAQMKAAVENVARHAADIAQAARESIGVARDGGHVVQQTVEGMQQISRTEAETARKINELGRYSSQVGEIVGVISEIADQTNLLALNAAIEAARAGEHGKGFAVVADEVRKLAERSAQSASEITELVRTIQEGTEAAVEAMKLTTAEVDKGLDLSNQAGEALERILAAFETLNEQIQVISEETDQLRSGIEAVTHDIESIASVTEENSAATEEMAAQSEQVNASLENISSISEETAAAAEEVSASTEEASASSEQMASSAQAVAELARNLRRTVANFRV